MSAQRGPAEASGLWAQACQWAPGPWEPQPPWGLEVLSERKSSEQKGWLLKVSQWGSGPLESWAPPPPVVYSALGVGGCGRGFSSGWLVEPYFPGLSPGRGHCN